MKTRHLNRVFDIILVMLLALVCSNCKHSKHPSSLLKKKQKPKIGLVLGGGGAKAAAEIGVLKKLRSMGVMIDCVAGSSMGAVIGSLYAAGYTPEEIENILLREKWMKLFDFTKVLSNKDFHPSGLIKRPVFQWKLDSLLTLKKARLFDRLKIPFRCTATIVSSDSLGFYEFKDGVVASGVTASISHPIWLRPWFHEKMPLFDGGMIDNLPVQLAKNMNADIIIAVDVQDENSMFNTPFSLCDKLEFLSNTSRLGFKAVIQNTPYVNSLNNWLEVRPDIKNREKVIEEAKKLDSDIIYIHINMDYDIFDYNKCGEIIDLGYNAAEAQMSEIKKKTVDFENKKR